MNSPVFVISNPRSGSTLLRSILSAHSQIAIPHEFPLIQELINYKTKSSLGNFNDLWRHLIEFKHFQDWKLIRSEVQKEHSGLKECTVNSVGNMFYSFFLNPYIENKLIWGEKNIGNIGYLNQLVTHFPNARFIFLIRDPRAVVNSILNRRWLYSKYLNKPRRFMKSIYGASSLWNDGIDLMEEFSGSNVHTLKYEDLVANLEIELRGICDFLNLSFQDRLLNYQNFQDAKLAIPSSRSKSDHGNIGKPVDSSISKSFRHQLNDRQLSIIESICSQGMDKFDYEKSVCYTSGLRSIPSKLINFTFVKLLWPLIKIKKKIFG